MLSVAGPSLTTAELLSACLERRVAFAAYRLPDGHDVSVVIQTNPHRERVEDLAALVSSGAFVIAPFGPASSGKRVVVHADLLLRSGVAADPLPALESISGAPRLCDIPHAPRDTSREEFLEQARLIIDATRSGTHDKAVLSRVKSVEGHFFPRLTDIFGLLCDSYPNAFVYLFQVGGQCWCGASPEPLLCSRQDTLVTVSLAGTRPFGPANLDVRSWGSKEVVEHEYVTQQIEDVLSDFDVVGASRNGPLTRRAGQLLHLCTEFTFPYGSVASRLDAFVAALHPTAAVCGIPREKSMQLIAAVERHDRELYAGYLGPVGLDGPVQLFANLRCMKVYPDRVVLFVGGGITSDSVPEDEWEETEMKAETLLSVIRGIG